MATVLIFAIILATSLAQDPYALLECVEGSETGAKIEAAFAACLHDNDSDQMRNGDTCYDFNSTIAWLKATYFDDHCVLSHMGWINEDGGYNWDMWLADINGLPEDVATALLEGEDEWNMCVTDKTTEWGNDPCFNGTESLYSEDEKMMLAQIGTMVAQYECFRDGLNEACFGDDTDVLEQCVADSATGDKIENAFDNCFYGNEESDRSLAKHLQVRNFESDGTECHDYNTTMEWLYKIYEGDICVLNDMGWFLNNGTTGFNHTQFVDDINGLPEATAQGVWDKTDEWNECVAHFLEKGSQDPCYSGSVSLYNDDEKEIIGTIGTMIVQYECFKHYFQEVCNELFDSSNYT